MRAKLDSLLVGTIIGLITPLIVLLVYYQINYSYLKVDSFLMKMLINEVVLPLLSLCVIGNLAVFYLFINKNYILAARGIILATILYAIAVFIGKLF